MQKQFKFSFYIIMVFFLFLTSCNSIESEPEIDITINKVSPTSVRAGKIITITGKNFEQINGAIIGNVNAPKIVIDIVSNEEIRMVVPKTATLPGSLILISGSRKIKWDGQLIPLE